MKILILSFSNNLMVGYYKKDHTVYSPGYEDLDDTGWYDEHDEFICGAYDVMAWMPLPERYKPEEANWHDNESQLYNY